MSKSERKTAEKRRKKAKDLKAKRLKESTQTLELVKRNN